MAGEAQAGTPTQFLDAPRMDLNSVDSTNRLIFRLKKSNRALDNLRRALEDDGASQPPLSARES